MIRTVERIGRMLALSLIAVASIAAHAQQAQEPAKATDLPGKPFSILKTWTIGGEGSWDYLAFDAKALQLFIAHESAVQVVDVTTGKLAGQVTGLTEAHDIALDDSGQFGYVTDGRAAQVKVFDRRSFEVIASIPTAPSPRAIVFDPATHLVFAICLAPRSGATGAANTTAVRGRTGNQNPQADTRTSRNAAPLLADSAITVIDTVSNTRLGDFLISGRLGSAQADGKGEIFVNIIDRSRILHFDAQTLTNLLQTQAAVDAEATQMSAAKTASSASASAQAAANGSLRSGANGTGQDRTPSQTSNLSSNLAPSLLDWTEGASSRQTVQNPFHRFPVIPSCTEPSALAIDSAHLRLFVDCSNGKIAVLDAVQGRLIATLNIATSTDAIAYDPNRNLIYVANNSGLGSLTIVRQSVTDSYDVIQDLPTQARARTLAVNPVSGEVYLVTNLTGFDLSKPGAGGGTHTLPVVQASPVQGSFHVLVVGTGEE